MSKQTRILVGYDECRCVLTQYCDGECRPVFADRSSRYGAAILQAATRDSPMDSGECFIVKGSGETDLPVVHIALNLESARHAVLSLMYSDPADAEDTEELFDDFDERMQDDNYWDIAFEIGGISVEQVCLDTIAPKGDGND